MHKVKKPMIVKHEDLLAKVYRGKYGEYRYKSPRFGYKRAWKYDRIAFIYIADKPERGYIDNKLFKYANRQEIINYMAEFKKSRKYLKAIS